MTLKGIIQSENSFREGVIELYKNNIKTKKEMIKIKALNMV